MDSPSFDRLYGRRLTLDVCRQCHGVWFDDQELLQLTPGATLQLLTALAEDRGVTRQPWSAKPKCPRCSRVLVETHDLQRSTRFTYSRCPEGHGRFLTFYQFLRAKNFVRPPSEDEVKDLRARIQQINCANCGAPVNVERDAACAFCHTPLAIIDPDQVKKTLAELKAAADEKKGVDPTLPVSLAIERLRAERAFAGEPGTHRRPTAMDLLFGDLSDPVIGFVRLLGRLRHS
jgi:hypothetical protein